MNIFTLLGMPLQYDIDMNLLHNNYRNLQKSTHPDMCLRQSVCNDANSDAKITTPQLPSSAEITDAYIKLKSPLLRAIALMQIHAYNSHEDKNSWCDDARVVADHEFLEEQFELCEAIERLTNEVNGSTLSSDVNQALYSLLTQTKNKHQETIHAISHAFSDKKEASIDFVRLKQLIARLAYYDKTIKQLHGIITN